MSKFNDQKNDLQRKERAGVALANSRMFDLVPGSQKRELSMTTLCLVVQAFLDNADILEVAKSDSIATFKLMRGNA